MNTTYYTMKDTPLEELVKDYEELMTIRERYYTRYHDSSLDAIYQRTPTLIGQEFLKKK